MKKYFFFIVGIFLLGLNLVSAQTYQNQASQDQFSPTKSGSWMMNGTFAFSSMGGDLYKDSQNNRLTTIQLGSAFSGFVTSGFAIGGKLNLSYTTQGNNSSTQILIGPSFQYFLPTNNSKIYPYIGATFVLVSGTSKSEETNYYGTSTVTTSTTGSAMCFGVGAIFMLNKYVGLDGELNYQIETLNSEGSSNSGNQINIVGGIVVFLY